MYVYVNISTLYIDLETNFHDTFFIVIDSRTIGSFAYFSRGETSDNLVVSPAV